MLLFVFLVGCSPQQVLSQKRRDLAINSAGRPSWCNLDLQLAASGLQDCSTDHQATVARKCVKCCKVFPTCQYFTVPDYKPGVF